MKPLIHRRIHLIVDLLLIMKPKLHLRRMYIHIHILAVDLHMQRHKRIFMLHGEVFVRILDSL